jgi:hypothetical protein
VEASHTVVRWRKSSRCSNNGCIEVAEAGGHHLVRDSTQPDSGTLAFSTIAWCAFVRSVRDGEFQTEPPARQV